jgi:hypothetical protein
MLAGISLITAYPAFARRRLAQTPVQSGPALQDIVAELEKPLPPLETTDSAHLLVLQQPPALGDVESSQWPNRLRSLAVYASLSIFGWCIATRKLPRPRRRAQPDSAPTRRPAAKAPTRVATMPVALVQNAAPEPLTNAQVLQFKALTSFSAWRELLTAARAGNRAARAVLDASPGHAAVQFQLTADDFTRDFAYVRNVVLSRSWVAAILDLIRVTERFDARITIATPMGGQQELPLDASIEALNRVLAYEGVPPEIRRQLELRRWILWQTRTDGATHTEVLNTFPPRDPLASRAVSGAA